jgi:hypothetical protein
VAARRFAGCRRAFVTIFFGRTAFRPGFFAAAFLVVFGAAAVFDRAEPVFELLFFRVLAEAVPRLGERLLRIALRAFVANAETASPTAVPPDIAASFVTSIPDTATSSPTLAVSTMASFAVEIMPSRSLSKVASYISPSRNK